MNRFHVLAPCVLAAALVPSLALAQSSATAPGQARAPSAERTAPLSQADALGVLSAINQSEIAAGQLAQQKVTTGPVHDYAARMVQEHGENEQKTKTLSPNERAAAAVMQKQKGQAELAKLQPLDSAAFQKAYVAAMVKDHGEALKALDQKLIPAAQDANVKAHLTETRAHVANHLAAAQKLQAAAPFTANAGGDKGH